MFLERSRSKKIICKWKTIVFPSDTPTCACSVHRWPSEWRNCWFPYVESFLKYNWKVRKFHFSHFSSHPLILQFLKKYTKFSFCDLPIHSLYFKIRHIASAHIKNVIIRFFRYFVGECEGTEFIRFCSSNYNYECYLKNIFGELLKQILDIWSKCKMIL